VSLRARLLVLTVVLVTAGLLVADIATYAALRSFLNDRVEHSLDAASGIVVRGIYEQHGLDPGEIATLASAAGGVFIQVRDSNGTVIYEAPTRYGQAVWGPRLPANLGIPGKPGTAAGSGPGPGPNETFPQREFSAPGRGSSSTAFRVRSMRLPIGATVSVAVPLNERDDTLARLFRIELAVTLAVLAAAGLASFWLVRRSLRPLDDIGDTAAAIAAGDLGQRIARAEPRTEVGRLGLALNGMLGHIERAFAEREASEARLRRFVADASHELRTPLTAVRAYAELFRRGADRNPDDLSRAMGGIETEAERMGVLVDDLLLLARLDEGRPLAKDKVDLAEVVEEAVEAARAISSDYPLQLASTPGLIVVGDKGRLRQVVDNLLGNIRTHTPAGTAARVSLAPEDGAAVLRISDDGPGLSVTELEQVFERFYRGDPSRSRLRGGTGLGLAIVSAITTAHGGRATVSSTPGAGATFTISLPLASTPVPVDAPSRQAVAIGHEKPATQQLSR
jgi:two-component system, OmpR family, sensor kinase